MCFLNWLSTAQNSDPTFTKTSRLGLMFRALNWLSIVRSFEHVNTHVQRRADNPISRVKATCKTATEYCKEK